MRPDRLNIVLCWHMHQPWYRDGLDGDYRLPWVYLHALKDYSDMAAHLEQHPDMKVVVNFSPILLEQLDDYGQQLGNYLKQGTPMQDRLLNLLAGVEAIPSDRDGRCRLLRECQRCHAPTMIHPYPVFQRLLSMVGATDNDHAGVNGKQFKYPMAYLSDQYFLDLLTWYHLVWLGESLRTQAEVKALFKQTELFDADKRLSLLHIMHRCITQIIPRYRALAERGQIELSMTPYMHPIIPLLQDFNNMRCSLPDAPAPQAETYPQGEDRARWHMEKGLALFEKYFGRKPQGVWLSEGGVSESAVRLLDEIGIRWNASGEGVWRNSMYLSGYKGEDVDNKRSLFMPYRQAGQTTRTFFRDDGLSDLIGFKYSTWHSYDAVADFCQHLEDIAIFLGDNAGQQVVSIILDGENAWEYYPHNAWHFLEALYNALSHSDSFKMTHFSEIAETLPPHDLPKLCAGSWVYGSFSTWIGSEDKNRGWDYLAKAKQAYDEVIASGQLSAEQQEQASHQLGVCEGSDWFWWFGDYNSSGSVSDFEKLYRLQLTKLYSLLGLKKPAYLDIPLSKGGGQAENAGTMRRNT